MHRSQRQIIFRCKLTWNYYNFDVVWLFVESDLDSETEAEATEEEQNNCGIIEMMRWFVNVCVGSWSSKSKKLSRRAKDCLAISTRVGENYFISFCYNVDGNFVLLLWEWYDRCSVWCNLIYLTALTRECSKMKSSRWFSTHLTCLIHLKSKKRIFLVFFLDKYFIVFRIWQSNLLTATITNNLLTKTCDLWLVKW